MEWHHSIYTVTDDPARLDMDFVCRLLKESYWAADRPRSVIEASFNASLPFSMIARDRPIGFARAITDRATFSWICDVMIAEDFRGQGLGTWLMQCIAQHPHVAPTIQHTNTRNAHPFYARLGFVRGELLSKWPPHSPRP